MNIKRITIEEYQEFINKENVGYLHLQSPAFAKMRNRFVIAGFQEDKITHAVIIESRPALHFFRYAYSAGDYITKRRDLDKEFLREATKFLKKDGFILWQMESTVEDFEYDGYGNKVLDSFDNTNYKAMLEDLGFVYQDLGKGNNVSHQCTWQSVIELRERESKTGYPSQPTDSAREKSFEEVRQGIKSTKKRGINKAIKEGFHAVIRKPSEMSEQDWKDFGRMIENAEEYHHFDVGGLEKQKDLALAFGDDFACIITIYDKEEHPVFSGLWLMTNTQILYYMGGMDRELSHAGAPALAQQTMLGFGIERGLFRYNFGGISGYFEQGEDGFGVYRYKRELGATVIRTFGPFNKPLNGLGKLFLSRLI